MVVRPEPLMEPLMVLPAREQPAREQPRPIQETCQTSCPASPPGAVEAPTPTERPPGSSLQRLQVPPLALLLPGP